MWLGRGRTLGEIFTLARDGDPAWAENRVLQILIPHSRSFRE
jgi:hypothetical protein